MNDRRGGGREARVALAIGLGIVGVYAGLAAWSASITPLARSPLLDGLPPVDYRWVAPPPELESTNQPPSVGRFEAPLERRGSGTQVFFTADNQVTVIVNEGSFGPSPQQESVGLLVEPVDPAGLGSLPGDDVPFGNAYLFSARYAPSRAEVRTLERPIKVILVYPITSLHAGSHDLAFSRDGTTWELLETVDSAGQYQAEADLPDLGYVMVVGVPGTSPSPAPPVSGGTPPAAIALFVTAGVVLLIGVGLLLRSRAGGREPEPHSGEPPAERQAD